MAKRPVFWPELGQFFEQFREAKGWGQRQAAETAKRRGLTALTRQVLIRLETGQTKNPDPEVLRAFAALYGVPYGDVVAQWVRHRFAVDVTEARDLGRHAGDQRSGSHQGGPADVPASARILELERRNTQLEAAIRALSDVGSELIDIAATVMPSASAGAETVQRKRTARQRRR